MTDKHSANIPSLSPALRYCELILPQVSRTFAINIRVLEGELYRAVLTAYLFCRMVDSVEDSPSLELGAQVDLLERYAHLFSDDKVDSTAVSEWRNRWGRFDAADPEQSLVKHCENVFALFNGLTSNYRDAIRDCVVEMALGMRSTLVDNKPNASGICALGTLEELEQYCYYVAGTVGKMLTRLFIANILDLDAARKKTLGENELSFALGLQLTNIIKDCSSDFGRGWCYVPSEMLQDAGVAPSELLMLSKRGKVLQVLNRLIVKTAGHLEDALEYTLAIPATNPKIRLFNLWSLQFAVRTLARAWDNSDLLERGREIKIPRHEVYRTIAETRISVGSDSILRELFSSVRSKIPDSSTVASE